MGIMNILLAFGLATGAIEQAPPAMFDLMLRTEMRFDDKPGGNSSYAARPLVKGQSLRMRTYSGSNSCGFSAGVKEFDSAAAIGWQVDAMPVEITTDHAVLRLHWSREVELGRIAGKEFQEAVVLLRPGDSLPLDSFVLPAVPGGCNSPVGTLVVGLMAHYVERVPVTSTDVWLVHKHPDGKETTQHLNVRGELNSRIPFFFDPERADTAALDVFGAITLRPKAGGLVALELSAQRLLVGEPNAINSSYFGNPEGRKVGGNSRDLAMGGGGQMVIQIGPESVTSFEIPQGSGPGWEAFAGHSLALRVQSKRLR